MSLFADGCPAASAALASAAASLSTMPITFVTIFAIVISVPLLWILLLFELEIVSKLFVLLSRCAAGRRDASIDGNANRTPDLGGGWNASVASMPREWKSVGQLMRRAPPSLDSDVRNLGRCDSSPLKAPPSESKQEIESES